MGREIRCFAEIEGWVGDGRLLLETDQLLFRGARRLVVPLTSIRSVRDDSGWLVVEHGTDELARFDLGKLAPSWVNAITKPRTRMDRLDVKPDARVRLVGEHDPDFADELRTRTPHVSVSGDDVVDIVFLRLDDPSLLSRLPELRTGIEQNGAIWVVHPRGDAAFAHDVLVGAAKQAGLIDNRTARFSDTHTALRFVIPRAARTRA